MDDPGAEFDMLMRRAGLDLPAESHARMRRAYPALLRLTDRLRDPARPPQAEPVVAPLPQEEGGDGR